MVKADVNQKSSGILVFILFILLIGNMKTFSGLQNNFEVHCKEPQFVQVEGSITSPGVYEFCLRPTIIDVMQKAGESVESEGLPRSLQRLRISSGARILFKRENGAYQFLQAEMPAFYKVTLGLPLSLNRESEVGLTALPGIGPRLARQIVLERSKRGGFKLIQEVMDTPGVGPYLYDRIRPYLTL
jgi:competence protein ComEA